MILNFIRVAFLMMQAPPPPDGPPGPPGLPINNIGVYLFYTAIIFGAFILLKNNKKMN